jgi:hypothetical protein
MGSPPVREVFGRQLKEDGAKAAKPDGDEHIGCSLTEMKASDAHLTLVRGNVSEKRKPG